MKSFASQLLVLPVLAVAYRFSGGNGGSGGVAANLAVNVSATPATNSTSNSPAYQSTVRHQKVAGNGYKEGSPLYEKQQKLQENTTSGETGTLGVSVPDVGVPTMPEVFPVPAASRCIVIITVQFMIISTALFFVRTYHELSGTVKGNLEAALTAAGQTLTYGPMLCVLFIACRMRVEFLSDGKGAPPMWVQNCFYSITLATLLSSFVVLLIPLVTGKPLPLKEGSCDLAKPSHDSGSKMGFYVLSGLRYFIMIDLYFGLAGVIVGINTYLPPGETDLTKLPPPAPAVMCTMIIAVLFFVTQLIIAGCRSVTEFTGHETAKLVGVMSSAANTVEFGPMLCILFLSARMRALQHDGQPQAWAQDCMYGATTALVVTTLLAILVPLALGGTMEVNARTRQATFKVPHEKLGYVLVALRYLCMACFYGCAVAICVSICYFKAPKGPTLPVSPAVQCVMSLTAQFFFVYLMLNIMSTASQLSGGRLSLENHKSFVALEAAKATLAFAPMLAILFVTTRMYALLITDKKGAPQAWVQDGMFSCTWALTISFCMCMATGAVMDEVKVDRDGNVVNKFSNKYVAIIMIAIRYITLFMLYSGICTVIYGLFVMTPETANGKGSIPYVSDAVGATPIGGPPPGPGLAAEGSF